MAEAQKLDSTTAEDVQKNKTMAILAWFIFFLPLLTEAKDSKFAKFHANQALLADILWIIAIIGAPFVIGFFIFPVAGILWLIGIISAVNGQMKRLPLIGSIDIIK